MAMEAHENEPKIRRFCPPFTCRAIQMQAVPVARDAHSAHGPNVVKSEQSQRQIVVQFTLYSPPHSGFHLFEEQFYFSSRSAYLDRRVKEKIIMPSGAFQTQATNWLAENGPAKLELLFRAIGYRPSAPVLAGDDDRHFHHARSEAGKLPGFSRDGTIGRSSDDFIEPDLKPQISGLEKAFPQRDEQEGTLRFVGLDGSPRELENIAKPRDKTNRAGIGGKCRGCLRRNSGMGSTIKLRVFRSRPLSCVLTPRRYHCSPGTSPKSTL